ncbi:MAG: alpha/beta fold hydrolase [Acidimicrobiia bacterium]|nr:alpha/beta fold hydrolase [Acidimicrobiia bacterium]
MRYRFDDFELDLDRFELRRGGEVQRVEPQVFDVLTHLVRNAGRVVPKEELLDHVWGDRFVSESALTSRIKAVRAAVGDSGRSQRLVRTVHGRGYLFQGEVVEATDRPAVTPARAEPATRYARSGAYHLAYQVIGDGPPDLVFIPGFVSNVELQWQLPGFAEFFQRLGSFARLIVFDKRGTGLSDRVPLDEIPTIEERMDDVRAVMDAAGSERATLFGISEGGPMALVLAATFPDRVDQLVICNSFVEGSWGEREIVDLDMVERSWGEGLVFSVLAPSWARDPAMRQQLGRYERHAASPQVARQIIELATRIDVRGVLPAVHRPTTVVHRRDDPIFPFEQAERMAAAVAGAELVGLPGHDHFVCAGDAQAVLDIVEQRVTGQPGPPVPSQRVLATVAFVDIVGSTATARELGDRRWRDLLDRFHTVTGEAVATEGGRRVKTTGDGYLALFDGPARAIRSTCSARAAAAGLGLAVRAGVHTAEVELVGDDVAGIGVHIGARVAGEATPGEVWVSRTVRDLVAGSGLRFADRGSHALQGLDESWALYAVE